MVSSLPRLAADVETRCQEALCRVEQVGKASRPFKYADALKAAQGGSASIDQLMADKAKPEELVQPERKKVLDPGWKDATADECVIPKATGRHDHGRPAKLTGTAPPATSRVRALNLSPRQGKALHSLRAV